jgi:hypothetical protein
MRVGAGGRRARCGTGHHKWHNQNSWRETTLQVAWAVGGPNSQKGERASSLDAKVGYT